MKYARAHPRPVEKGKTEVIRELTKARLRVIECLQEGMDHPDHMAKHLKITRQAVDPHLQILCDLGIVSKREGITEITGRPRVRYGITREGQKLLNDIENAELNVEREELEYIRDRVNLVDQISFGFGVDHTTDNQWYFDVQYVQDYIFNYNGIAFGEIV